MFPAFSRISRVTVEKVERNRTKIMTIIIIIVVKEIVSKSYSFWMRMTVFMSVFGLVGSFFLPFFSLWVPYKRGS